MGGVDCQPIRLSGPSIILTTITDIISMGSMLMLASMLISYLT
jgi:hypothetical protein